MKFIKKFIFILIFALLFTGCGETPTSQPSETPTSVEPSVEVSETEQSTSEEEPTEAPIPEWVDYVSQTKLNLNDETKIWAEVKVSTYVDGDTTHFITKGTPSVGVNDEDGILKARYNSCDTPESTGKVEPWGESAKKWTRQALEGAQSIILQSDSTNW